MRLVGGRLSRLAVVRVATFVALTTAISAAFANAAQSPPRRVIDFAPVAVTLDNPTESGGATAPSSFSITFKARGSRGGILKPGAARPLMVKLYGAPAGVVTPTEITLTDSATANFNYNGGYFPNPITVEAWIANGDGDAIGV